MKKNRLEIEVLVTLQDVQEGNFSKYLRTTNGNDFGITRCHGKHPIPTSLAPIAGEGMNGNREVMG